MSMFSIVAALSLVSGATFAVFTDQATSQENTFSTGNADLVIAEDVPPGDPGTYANDIAGVNISGIAPGFTMDKDFWLKNSSTSTGMSLTVTGDLANLGGSNHGTDGTLPDKLLVRWQCDTDNNGLEVGSDFLSSEFSVRQWVDGGNTNLGTVGPNEGLSDATTASDQDELLCRMKVRLAETAGNEVAGGNISFDGVYDATQVVPTPTP